MPWLSVIIPTRNGACYLAAALDSIVAQGDDNLEVILVDDGSTDETLEIAKSYLARLPLRIVACEHRGSWVAGTNDGMALATGAYLSWLHQDDIWHPARLSVMRELVRRNPHADLFVHPVSFMDASSRQVGTWRCPLPSCGGPIAPAQVIERLLVQDFLASTAPIFKASAAHNAGPLDEELWFNADWDYWLKLAGAGETVYHPEVLSSFRVHRGSQTMTRLEEFGMQYHQVLDRHLPRWEGALPNFSAIVRAARFSADVNIAFARWVSREPTDLVGLLARFLALGPSGWRRYLRDSRILERVISRLRAGLLSPDASPQLAAPTAAPILGAN